MHDVIWVDDAESQIKMTTPTEVVQMLKNDPDFCRGFRRGVGLVLASFVVSQCLGCALYPLLGDKGGFLSAMIMTGLSIIFVARGL